MMKVLVLLATCLLGTALGQTRVTANYDDLKFTTGFTVPLGGPNTTPDAPFTYKSLVYTNWYQGTSLGNSTGSAGGVAPASRPNVIGSPQYKADQSDADNHPLKRIAIAKPNKSFDLLEFSYGCSGLSVVAAVGCSLAVTGTYANGGQVPTASFNYFSTLRANSGTFRARLPDWFKGLSEVTIGAGDGEFGGGPTVQVLDNVYYQINA